MSESHRYCAAMENHFHAAENEEGYASRRRHIETKRIWNRIRDDNRVVTIPVVVHNVYNKRSEKISDSQIKRQIEILNEDFRAKNIDIKKTPKNFRKLIADPRIEFALATVNPLGEFTTGIVRQKTSIKSFPQASVPQGKDSTPYIDKELKSLVTGSPAWPNDDYLNIWVCNMNLNPLGYAAFPGGASWKDGIVIDVKCFGISKNNDKRYNKGRTSTHEIGHYLDLLHIWGDGKPSCNRSDNVNDTPSQKYFNFGKPTYPSISCNNGPDGDLFMNYMDLVDDSAMFMFTKGQIKRMRDTLFGVRSSLLFSSGLGEKAIKPDFESLLFANVEETTGSKKNLYYDGVDWVKGQSIAQKLELYKNNQ